MTSPEAGSVPAAEPVPSGTNLEAEEALPEPVFVDGSGLRGRLLRGLGWPVSLVGAVLAVAMGGSLVGMQADAPALGIPPQPAQSPAAPAPSPSAVPSTPAPSASPGAKPGGAASSPAKPKNSPSAPARSTASTASTAGLRGAAPTGAASKHP
ncbi:hypothetical protein ACIQBJ_07790 [Kitasatospora sp. NPDC088391]|uniref:hypothetical protein n=1 Tax=Kitasatospora sp. NPDC088391 TaxID=3364074 RepID=UPI0037F3E03A